MRMDRRGFRGSLSLHSSRMGVGGGRGRIGEVERQGGWVLLSFFLSSNNAIGPSLEECKGWISGSEEKEEGRRGRKEKAGLDAVWDQIVVLTPSFPPLVLLKTSTGKKVYI